MAFAAGDDAPWLRSTGPELEKRAQHRVHGDRCIGKVNL